jgi:hypothetical protein
LQRRAHAGVNGAEQTPGEHRRRRSDARLSTPANAPTHSCHGTLQREKIASHRIASHRTASHRIASHRIASHREQKNKEKETDPRPYPNTNPTPDAFCRMLHHRAMEASVRGAHPHWKDKSVRQELNKRWKKMNKQSKQKYKDEYDR